MIADRRAPDAPPVDSLAEAIVLRHCLVRPSLIDDVDLGPLLHFGEHRRLWDTLKRARLRCPGEDYEAFVLAWVDEVRQLPDLDEPKQLYLVNLLLQDVSEHESARAFEELDRKLERDPDGAYGLHECRHDFEWWLERLKAIHQAREGIRAAQEQAERWWRVPDEPYDVETAQTTLRRLPQEALASVPRSHSLADVLDLS